MIVSAELTTSQTINFNKHINENHKKVSDFLRQIIETYFNFEKAGYLDIDGNKIKTLETEIQLKEKLRQIEAARLDDKLHFERELQSIKNEAEKERARNRAARRGPRIDWGDAKGVDIERSNLE